MEVAEKVLENRALLPRAEMLASVGEKFMAKHTYLLHATKNPAGALKNNIEKAQGKCADLCNDILCLFVDQENLAMFRGCILEGRISCSALFRKSMGTQPAGIVLIRVAST